MKRRIDHKLFSALVNEQKEEDTNLCTLCRKPSKYICLFAFDETVFCHGSEQGIRVLGYGICDNCVAGVEDKKGEAASRILKRNPRLRQALEDVGGSYLLADKTCKPIDQPSKPGEYSLVHQSTTQGYAQVLNRGEKYVYLGKTIKVPRDEAPERTLKNLPDIETLVRDIEGHVPAPYPFEIHEVYDIDSRDIHVMVRVPYVITENMDE